MGCDYYIVKVIEIRFYNSLSPIRIELERDRGYFNFDIDEDDPLYDEKEKEYIDACLTPSMTPIVIYKNSEFSSEKLESKYKNKIEYYLIEDHLEWKDVCKIVKYEYRYERD
jgi:hypothetical protein